MSKIQKYLSPLIVFSERILKTDVQYLVKGGFWLSSGQLFSILCSFGLSIIFANLLPKEIYGNYKFILSATSILGGLSLTGLGGAVIQAVAKDKEGVFKKAINTSLRWSILTITAGGIIAGYYWLAGNSVLSLAILLSALAMPIINSYGLWGAYLNGQKKFGTVTTLAMIAQAMSTFTLAITAIFFRDAFYLVVANLGSSLITTILFYGYVIKKYPPNQEDDPTFISYGKHVSLMNFFGTIASQLDKILIFHYLGSAQLAIYSLAIAIPEQIRGSYKNLFNLALPKYGAREDDFRSSIIDKVSRLTLLSIILVVIYFVFSPLVFKIFFPKYLSSIAYSRFYIFGLIAIPGTALFSTYFQIKKETSILYRINFIGNFVMIILSYFLVKNFGLWGAVIENSSAWFVMLLIGAFYFFFSPKNKITTT